ncbi:hypothetical protein T12_11436 [Trichinella patagoniensis]|uniref:Uncharacterized protein n=1 Tax=Trichinella patagoniensis TaxID=990121 RepID=A0A0V0Z5F8_9BILA|nr:hypothetical protein T12_11436 [Trichinella patagoniensis]
MITIRWLYFNTTSEPTGSTFTPSICQHFKCHGPEGLVLISPLTPPTFCSKISLVAAQTRALLRKCSKRKN